MKKSLVILFIGFLLGSIPLLTITFAEDEQIIPGWIKNTAKFWVEGGVSDTEFINAIQYMVTNGIIELPTQVEKEDKKEDLPFEIDIISCGIDEFGYFNFEWSIKSNVDKNYILDLSLLQNDDNGDVLRATSHYTDTKAGRTIYDDRSADAVSGVDGCGIIVEEVIED